MAPKPTLRRPLDAPKAVRSTRSRCAAPSARFPKQKRPASAALEPGPTKRRLRGARATDDEQPPAPAPPPSAPDAEVAHCWASGAAEISALKHRLGGLPEWAREGVLVMG